MTRPREAFSLTSEIRFTLRLGVPLALGELGWMSTYIVDALMVGRLPNSALSIAASSLGNTIFYAIAFFFIYLMNGLETLIAQAYGRNDGEECAYLLAQSFWFVALGTPLVMGLSLLTLWLLPHFGTPRDIVDETSRYLHPLIWSAPPLMGYMALRRYLQSVDNVLWVSLSLLTAGAVNWFFDWVFLFGHLGSRALGIAGSAWGTLAVRIFMLLLLTIGAALATRRLGQKFRWGMLRPDKARIGALLRIGWPSGLEMSTELAGSTYLSVLCSRLGATLLAAQQVVLDLNAFVYQPSAGLSYATIVRVGQSAGRVNLIQVRRATNASLIIALSYISVVAPFFGGFSHFWAGLYTNSEAVVLAAMPIFTLCAFMLVADTLFVILASTYTGLGDTRTPMLVSLIWNWLIGMPLSYLFAFHYHLALRGLWYGRATASIGAALTIFAMWRMSAQPRPGSPKA